MYVVSQEKSLTFIDLVQWYIEGMAGMARAMGATLTGGEKIARQKLKPLFTVSWTFSLRPIHSQTGKLHQHIAPLPKALCRVCYASSTKHYEKTAVCDITRRSDIVTEQGPWHAISTTPHPSHAIRKDKSVRSVAFQTRSQKSDWDKFMSVAMRIWLVCK